MIQNIWENAYTEKPVSENYCLSSRPFLDSLGYWGDEYVKEFLKRQVVEKILFLILLLKKFRFLKKALNDSL